LLSEHADDPHESECGLSMHCDEEVFQAQADGPSFVFSSDAFREHGQVLSPRSVLSAQGAQQIASVFLEVVHASSLHKNQQSQTVNAIGSPFRPLSKHRVSKENKESKKQLASIIKIKASASQPLEEYQTARFAKRMQLYDAFLAVSHMPLTHASRCRFVARSSALQAAGVDLSKTLGLS
jgi:hypothetical protein